MQIIWIPGGVHKGQITSFGRSHLVVLLGVSLILSAVVGITGYHIYGLLNTQNLNYAMTHLKTHQEELKRQRETLYHARNSAETHLNALAKTLGSLQAQMLRLNALGGRLTRMAHLDEVEFDFNSEPAMGGPEVTSEEANNPVDFMMAMQVLGEQMNGYQERLMALETLLQNQNLREEVTPSGWPVMGGWISSDFGWRTDPMKGYKAHHFGIDIANPLGTPIKAMADGIVSYAGYKSGYGYMVDITHGNGIVTRYGHASAVLSRVGMRVSKGQPIGLVGATGHATGPHLHFEVRQNDRPIDPQPYLKQLIRP